MNLTTFPDHTVLPLEALGQSGPYATNSESVNREVRYN
jgi:hypothetical protein